MVIPTGATSSDARAVATVAEESRFRIVAGMAREFEPSTTKDPTYEPLSVSPLKHRRTQTSLLTCTQRRRSSSPQQLSPTPIQFREDHFLVITVDVGGKLKQITYRLGKVRWDVGP
ncbi:hypothetical protein TNCV_3780511 [Trichonephila clavipes]|nr:hypothetical protein TNCV_3780511 [Trichonephila clavipes]